MFKQFVVGSVLGLGALVATITLILGLTAGSWGLQWVTAPFRGSLDAREQIQASGSFRIAAYDHFFNLCASVQGQEAGIKATKAALERATSEREIERLSATLAGQTANRAGSIAQYNADARKSWTEGQFRDESLPFTLSVEGVTSCD